MAIELFRFGELYAPKNSKLVEMMSLLEGGVYVCLDRP